MEKKQSTKKRTIEQVAKNSSVGIARIEITNLKLTIKELETRIENIEEKIKDFDHEKIEETVTSNHSIINKLRGRMGI